MPLALPKSRAEISRIQSERKRAAVEQAKRAPYFRGKLDHVRLDRLDDPDEWRKIPILDKDMLRGVPDAQFYTEFCVAPADGIAEYWRSGGSPARRCSIRAASATSSSGCCRSHAPSIAPESGAASAPMSRFPSGSIRSGRSTRAAPRRAASR